MARILVTEELAPTGLEKLEAAGHEVDVRLGLSPDELLEVVPGAHALIIRSATTVTDAVLAAGTDLVIVGRAGIGLDNVDVQAATRHGVMVCNAPQSNIVTTAEQTMALILAQARNIPQADAALKAGRWERSKWTGIELADKTLGIVGLGRVGKLVAQRALAFGMRLIAYDPYVSADRAHQLSVELVDLDELAARADIVTLHVIKTPDTVGLIGADFIAKAKEGIRIVNVARGGVIDEAALYDGLVSGKVGAAALDVFDTEPKTESPLFTLPNVVVTPHLGASTHEAQDKAGVTIAEQVNLALAGDFVPFAVNIDAAEVAGHMRPFLPLAEQLGRMFVSKAGTLPKDITVRFEGEIGGYDNRLAALAAIKGLLSGSEEPVSYVNANPMLDALGVTVNTEASTAAKDYVDKLTICSEDQSMSATLVGLRDEARIIEVDGHAVDVPPSAHMLVVINDNRPGVIGTVGTILGRHGVNISDMAVGKRGHGESAMMLITTETPAGAEVLEELRAADGVSSVAAISS